MLLTCWIRCKLAIRLSNMEIMIELHRTVFKGVLSMKGWECLQERIVREKLETVYIDHSFKECCHISCLVCGYWLIFILKNL